MEIGIQIEWSKINETILLSIQVEIEIQTEATPLPPEEPKQEDTPPPKKAKLIDDEPQHMAPIFLTPLVGATVTEGVKFTFECK